MAKVQVYYSYVSTVKLMQENLTGVSETLLIPLYAKYLETQRNDAIIRDEKIGEIVNKLNFEFDKFSNKIWSTQIGCAIRTEILDQATRAFLAQNPSGVVVNLGAGLCTRFFRLDNGTVKWFELDLPSVKLTWEKVFNETDRHKYLAYSALDFSWINELKPISNSPVLFIAEGLFMYFEQPQVKQIIANIQQNFPGAQMLLEAYSSIVVRNYKRHPQVSKTKATFKWGIKTGKELEAWNEKIKFIEEWYYFDRYSSRWRWMQIYKYIPFLRKSMKIVNLKFQ